MREGSAPGGNGRTRGTGERGAGYFKSVVWLAILACLVYVGIKTVPVLFREYEFQDAMQTAARYGSVNVQTADDIRDALLKQAQDMNLPVKAEDIHVTKETGNVSISAAYSVTVDLGVYQWTFNFHPSAQNSAL